MIDKGGDKEFIWNPSNCECECDKFCDIGAYLYYSNCKCRKKLVNKLVEECIKSIDEVEITEATRAGNKCSFCTLYIVLFSIFLHSALELLLILFTTNTWVIMKKYFQIWLHLSSKKTINIRINGRS